MNKIFRKFQQKTTSANNIQAALSETGRDSRVVTSKNIYVIYISKK